MKPACYWESDKSLSEIKECLVQTFETQSRYKLKIQQQVITIKTRNGWTFTGEFYRKGGKSHLEGNLMMPLYLNIIFAVVFLPVLFKVPGPIELTGVLLFFALGQVFFYGCFKVHYRLAPFYYRGREELFEIINQCMDSEMV